MKSLLSSLFSKHHPDSRSELISRASRVGMEEFHRVSLKLKPSGEKVRVLNLSTTGVAIQVSGSLLTSRPGDMLEVILEIDSREYPAQVGIVHGNLDRLGCKFVGGGNELSRAIGQYLKVELAGHQMTAVNREVLKPDPDGEPQWMLGKKGTEFYFVQKGGRIVRFYGTFLNHYFEGGTDRKLRFGQVNAGERPDASKHAESDLVLFDSEISSEIAELALRFVQSIPTLSEAQKQELSRYFSGL